AERQKVVRLLVKEVLVDNDTITIRHSMPAQPTPPAGNAPPSTGKLRVHGESYLLRSGSAVAAVVEPDAGRAGQGARTARPLLCPIRRRLQHLRAQPAGGRASDGERRAVPDLPSQAEGQHRQERG